MSHDSIHVHACQQSKRSTKMNAELANRTRTLKASFLLFFRLMLFGCMLQSLSEPVNGQTLTPLHVFSPLSIPYKGTNADGATPHTELIIANNTVYGTAFWGGSCNAGTVFSINLGANIFTNLHNFSGLNEGGHPVGGLVLISNTLYIRPARSSMNVRA